jgi:rRNA maturation endonuclease Nob1
MKWYNCLSCDTEFRVVSDTGEYVEFCPYCGSTIDDEDFDDEELNEIEE